MDDNNSNIVELMVNTLMTVVVIIVLIIWINEDLEITANEE